MNDEQLFCKAIDVHVDDLNAFLESNCQDEQQRRSVEKLLAAHGQTDDLLDTEAMERVADTLVVHPIRKTIGDFEIVRELGRGGMGVVYEARQKSLKRRVALKILSSGLGLSSKAILRFRREAEAAGKLHHTNIVPIYTTGEDNGIHYYAMELIDGPSLDAVIKDLKQETSKDTELNETEADVPSWLRKTALYDATGPGTDQTDATTISSSSTMAQGSKYFDHVATMIAEVADALEHAHEHGVIHRDIKPSNLLLAPDGRLSVNDFGLARMLEQPGMTMSGEFVGSPLYMSPEQITAGRVTIDHRTDIYSLGATLYELLTLQPPFPGESRDQVLSHILQKDANAPRRINTKIPIDLDTICLKSIDKDPDQRYQSAGHLADDLRKFINRNAISARRLGPVGKVVKFARRRPAVALLLMVFLISTLTISYLILDKKRQALQNEKDRFVDSIFSGNLQDSKNHWNAADGLGADDAWLSLSRALIEFHSGNHVTAKTELDRAERNYGSSLAIDS
ncbi:MAG: serine/threonine-protein kinase, partial [Planctomycetota bacterium]